MKVDWNSKYTTMSVYSIITFTVCLLIYLLVGQFSTVMAGVKKCLAIISPIIWGVVIAYLLNPIMVWAERALTKLTDKKKPHPKLRRILSTAFSVLLLFAMLAALCAIIIPQMLDSITTIFNNMGSYLNNLEKWISGLLTNYPDIQVIMENQFRNLENSLTDFVNQLAPKLGDLVIRIKDGALSLVGALKDFFIGIIVAVYFLLDKEHFLAQGKKIICALFSEKASSTIFRISDHTNRSLSGFISGKIIDSIIIGVLFFICASFMHLEYTLLISVIVGVTNVIPFFGPFIGAIPSGLLLLMSAPNKVIPFIFLIVAIQQLDGNVIGPRILGQSTGLSAFWVMFAIFVGGGLFGFAGMLLGVPIFAVIYSLIEEFINSLLEKKGMPTDTMCYAVKAPVQAIKEKESKKMKSFRLFKENKAIEAAADKKDNENGKT